MNKADWDALAAADFYSRADKHAREFIRAHPEADRMTVHCAAMDAADNYERSEKLRKQHFETVVRMYIRTALLKNKRKESEAMKKRILTEEQKAEIVRLRETGLPCSKIAERFGVCAQTVLNVVNKMRKKSGSPETAAAVPDGSKEVLNETETTYIIPLPAENVKPEKPEELDTVAVMKKLAEALRSKEIGKLTAVFVYQGEEWELGLRKRGIE